jgi:integrase
MSCIYNRNGYYYYRGFGQRFSLQTRNKKEASLLKKKYDRRFATEQATGDLVLKPKRIQLKDAITEYLRYKKQNFAHRTYQTDKQRLNWISDFTGNISLRKISPNTIIDYADFRMKSVKRSTIRIDLICWKALMSYCVKHKYIRENPFIMYPIEKVKSRVSYLSLEEIKQLQEYKDPTRPWLPKLINLALLTGFRRGELASLEWENITKNSLRVIGKSGLRDFPNSSRIQSVLDSIAKESKWVFPAYRDAEDHLDQDMISRGVKSVFRRLGFPEDYCLHTLRHTFASHLALKGVPIQQISLLLGHKDIQTTMIYAHLLPNECKVDLPY